MKKSKLWKFAAVACMASFVMSGTARASDGDPDPKPDDNLEVRGIYWAQGFYGPDGLSKICFATKCYSGMLCCQILPNAN